MYVGDKMKFDKILKIFLVALPVCVVLRVLQTVFTIEYGNGFYIEEYKGLGISIMAIFLLTCLILGYISFRAYVIPEKLPIIEWPLAVSSVLLGGSLFAEAVFEALPETMVLWQVAIIKLAGCFCGVYFLMFGLQKVKEIKISSITHILPVVYLIVRAVITFINISSLAVISDNVILITGYCLLMLFFINFARLYNNLGNESTFRKILAFSLTSAVCCFIQSVGFFVVNLISQERYLHTDKTVNFVLLFFGFFVVTFTYSYFTNAKRYK